MTKFPRILLAALCAWCIPLLSQAGYGFFATGGSYIILNVDGGGNTYYYLSPTGGGNPAFNNANLGTFQLTVDTLVLNGFENNTYENGSDGVMNGRLNYRIYTSGNPSGSYTTVNHIGFGDLGGGNKRHDVTNSGINVLSGLTPGVYQLEAFPWAEITYNNGGPLVDDTIYADVINNGGTDATRYASAAESAYLFKASFTVTAAPVAAAVPEPGTAVFATLGAIALRFMTRKRR